MPTVSDRAGVALPRSRLLDSWTVQDWHEGCQLEELTELHLLAVHTLNSVYEIVVLSPRRGEVLVRGGRFFPERRPACLAGSTLGGSLLKVRGIYVGFRLELHIDREAIVTSPILAIRELRCRNVIH